MFIKDHLSKGNKLLLLYNKRKLKNLQLTNGFMLVLALMMFLMIVQVSSHQYQNQSTAIIRTRRIKGYNKSSQIITNITTTSTTKIAKSQLRSGKLRKTPRTQFQNKTATTNIIKQSKRKSIKDKRKSMRTDTQHQIREKQQQQQQHHQRAQHHANPGETAYLVERINNNDADERGSLQEQPIYGTWRAKAKRPQAPLVPQTHAVNISATTTTTAPTMPTTLAAAAAITVDSNEHDDHVYERLPRRSATMTPLRNELHDQLPRPPRLTSRHPSLLIRRQYMETPINASYRDFEQKPKPFHFPFDGPLPAEFKKVEPERSEFNSMQEHFQRLNLNAAASSIATRPPQLVMLPTGLHLAGSFKNFKSSGIANFFRNKRNKKQLQLSFPLQLQPMSIPKPMPLQFYGAYQPSYGAAMMQPYQRIAMDQFYPFKPHSLNEINWLAMQQQQQQQLNAKQVKNRKKKKNQQQTTNVGLFNNNNLLLQQTYQRPDHMMNFYPQHQWMLMNATQKPLLKRIPFKVNLDIFPVLPPTKATPLLRNPFVDNSNYQYSHAVPFQQQQQYQQQQLNEMNFLRKPTALQQHQNQLQQQQQQQLQQASNNHITYPDQVPKFTHHHQQQQQHPQQQQQQSTQQEPYQRPPLNPQQNSFTPIDFDCIEPPENENTPLNSNPNQIMVHLNVFPKPRTTATSLPSTNPFYSNSNLININRNTNIESSAAPTQLPQELRNLSRQTAYANDTVQQFYPKSQQRIARSDNSYAEFVDFEQPIVAADVSELPKPTVLVNNKLDASDNSPYYDHIETRNNLHFNTDSNIEQLSSEARAASLFRYPVEDLIQFHVDDAL